MLVSKPGWQVHAEDALATAGNHVPDKAKTQVQRAVRHGVAVTLVLGDVEGAGRGRVFYAAERVLGRRPGTAVPLDGLQVVVGDNGAPDKPVSTAALVPDEAVRGSARHGPGRVGVASEKAVENIEVDHQVGEDCRRRAAGRSDRVRPREDCICGELENGAVRAVEGKDELVAPPKDVGEAVELGAHTSGILRRNSLSGYC